MQKSLKFAIGQLRESTDRPPPKKGWGSKSQNVPLTSFGTVGLSRRIEFKNYGDSKLSIFP
ncbi:hypothetical protein LEP1GSC058_3657 [Leptospira fainei serovar Hurstbridge str. BUT 6]|uniref:Uncharacterized protein n=1 Tax=Leptospira fainei serovar Hurstbridge str. BUT 6 TaxID=1193011 RepID=S3UYS9_9LEPT|nr:hypothetical protein LEP1GSC058_3657 [Leptospira fainei serovar Hurstbridge str. BUT 6]